jgi:hypothetical protein
MKKITVAYWKWNINFSDLYLHNLIPYFKNNCTFDYSIEKQNEIVQIIIEHGFSVMLRPNLGEDKDTLIIYIDKGRFGQS